MSAWRMKMDVIFSPMTAQAHYIITWMDISLQDIFLCHNSFFYKNLISLYMPCQYTDNVCESKYIFSLDSISLCLWSALFAHHINKTFLSIILLALYSFCNMMIRNVSFITFLSTTLLVSHSFCNMVIRNVSSKCFFGQHCKYLTPFAMWWLEMFHSQRFFIHVCFFEHVWHFLWFVKGFRYITLKALAHIHPLSLSLHLPLLPSSVAPWLREMHVIHALWWFVDLWPSSH